MKHDIKTTLKLRTRYLRLGRFATGLVVFTNTVWAGIVINEIHYDPADKTSFEEFIELHNTDGEAVDLSGWRLRDAVEYTFPQGAAIPAHGFVVIARNPAVLNSTYGTTAFGPWDGRLSNDGEEIELYDAADMRMDRVDYRLGFPWPTLGIPWGSGMERYNASIELIQPELDNDLGGSWRSSGTNGPTPAAQNAAYRYTATIPPLIRQVQHEPSQPTSSDTVTITAKVTDSDGVSSVVLQYQLVEPGNYIPIQLPDGSTNATYFSDWTDLTMYDDGTHGDALPGDAVYTVEMPAACQAHRNLVRYRIAAEDSLANNLTVPYADDPQPNFAYFCYDGVPAWQGAVQPGITASLDFDTNIMRRLPAVHLLSRNTDVENATWFEHYWGDLYKWSGTLVYDGKVYDHIHYRARGGAWRYAMVKNMWKFDFNRGHDFQMRDDYGKKYDTKWTKLNLGACIQQRDGWHRGEQGMFESVGSRLFNLAGVPSFNTAFLQFRIIDDAEESSAEQYEGDFWGLYLAVEQLDGRFLDEHNLPDGNLYKMEYGTGELNNLGPLGPSNKSDLNYILSNYSGASDAWWTSNWYLDDYYSYQTIIQAIHHYDINNGKNYFYYRNPETGLWRVMPWDLDLTWADNMYKTEWGGLNALASRILDAGSNGTDLTLPGTTRAVFRMAFRNRIREIRDLLYNQDQAGQLIEEKAGLLRDPGVSPSFLDADRAMWDYNPKMDDPIYTYPSLSEKAKTGEFYQWTQEPEVSNDFEGCLQLMKNYIDERGAILDALAADADIPYTPSISYIGRTGYPLNSLRFLSSDFADPQGSGTFAAIEWRVGEVLDVSAPAYAPNEEPPYEISAKWESGELTAFGNPITIPVDALKVGHAYRVRVRMKDNSGRWSHWSEAVEFIASESSDAAEMQRHLRISELMVNPTAGSDYEFIELQNTSTNQSIRLDGAAFTEGIDFTFPVGTVLDPGQYLLVIGTTNTADFRNRYGLSTNVVIAGAYEGSLSNGGEELKLKTASGGTAIVWFEYDNNRYWPLAAAGAGHSLIPLTTTGQASGALDYPGNWKASAYIGGSPGAPDPLPSPMLILNEITAHTDYSDPAHPDYDSDDWIELYNPAPFTMSLADCYLSDDPSVPAKWACPAIGVPAHSYVVFSEVADFHNPISAGFGIDKAGEQVLLSHLPGSQADRVLDAVGFKGQENTRSYNFHDGYWYTSGLTQGSANSAPLPGLRISEVMYQPAPTGTNDNTRDEYIEIHNPTTSSVILQTNGEAWRISGGLEFTFPDDTTLQAGSSLLIVGFDPTDTAVSNAFTAAYGLSGNVRILGPWSGKLSNRSESISLERPQLPDLPGDPYSWVIEDETVYGNQDPWPAAAGNGLSLERLVFRESGLDPANWTAAAPTPGNAGISPYADQDGDGMSDYDEWLCGTDRYDPDSYFHVDLIDGIGIAWPSVPNRSYSIYWTGNLRTPFVPVATNLLYPQSFFLDSPHAGNATGFYKMQVEK